MSQDFVRFVDLGYTASGKTYRWQVQPKGTEGSLGEVRWFCRWRKYTFFPEPGTTFDAGCLSQIAGFCAAESTRKHIEIAARRLP
jgi:hypothetical protein